MIPVPSQRFGVYTVIGESDSTYRRQKTYDVRCDCGNERTLRLAPLLACPKYCSQCRPTKRVHVGQRFTRLVVLDPACERKKNRIYAKVECDCGRIVLKRVHNLLIGDAKSCGCLTRETGPGNRDWSGHGEISGEYFSRMRCTARLQKREWKVTIQELWDLFLQQGRRCRLSGLDLSFGDKEAGVRPTASLDRIDSRRGYTIDNVQWTHKFINVMKSNHDIRLFVELCTAVATTHPGGWQPTR